MFLIREARPKDLTGVLEVARHLDSYNLPADRKTIREIIEASQRSFRWKSHHDPRAKFLFVLEEPRRGNIIGSSLIIARHGTPELPHLAFRLGVERKKSLTLGKAMLHQTLELHASQRGYTELGGLVVLPRYRHHPEKLGKQLSYARFAYMAHRPRGFRKGLLVEFRPKMNLTEGNNFWKELGGKFTGLSYHKADRLSATNKEFALSLFPEEKVYCSFLSEKARRDLDPRRTGRGAGVHMLEKIGFRFLGQVDPFDGGPHYGAPFHRVLLIKKTRFYRFDERSPLLREQTRQADLVMAPKKDGVRAVLSEHAERGQSILLPAETVFRLRLRHGDRVSLTPFHL